MLPMLVFLFLLATGFAAALDGFIYNGFQNVDLSRDGIAEIGPNGLLRLTNYTKQKQGHAFYPKPIKFKNDTNGSSLSFSTTFVFAIVPQYRDLSGHGIAFVIAPAKTLPGALPSQYLGLFNKATNGNSSNHVVAVELDTIYSSEFSDINDNHVGVDINDLNSFRSEPVKYYLDDTPGGYKNLSLISGERMQVWIEYDGPGKQLEVTIAPVFVPKPKIPLLSMKYDISPILHDTMFVGFSSSTGSVLVFHYILGWSFQMMGQAKELDLSRLPRLPRRFPKKESKVLTVALPLILALLLLLVSFGTFLIIRRKKKFAEVFDDWELNYKPHRFSYKDLYTASRGFREKELLGIGGFGRVYKGILPTSKIEVAVKRVSHDSKQGMKEFIAEIVSIGQLRHRNLVQLLGYCRRKGELLLVYDFMPNGSLDKYLFDPMSPKLTWNQRFRILKGVASGLVYLHEGWDQVVIHRDIKASNVLVDGDFNGRLGDFGLARLYDHGTNPQTTHIVGTLGYLAAEIAKTGKATTSTDVYAFGAFLLEVACGRRPIEPLASNENIILVDWVFSAGKKGDIFETADPNLGGEYVMEEMELVLKLGLLCSHSIPTARPTMRQVVQYLNKDGLLPDLSSLDLSVASVTYGHDAGFDEFVSSSYPSSLQMSSPTVAKSLLSTGR